MSNSLVALFYLVSAILFIFALRGLSHPESSRKGNIFGIIGMIIAIITTLLFKNFSIDKTANRIEKFYINAINV